MGTGHWILAIPLPAVTPVLAQDLLVRDLDRDEKKKMPILSGNNFQPKIQAGFAPTLGPIYCLSIHTTHIIKTQFKFKKIAVQ